MSFSCARVVLTAAGVEAPRFLSSAANRFWPGLHRVFRGGQLPYHLYPGSLPTPIDAAAGLVSEHPASVLRMPA